MDKIFNYIDGKFSTAIGKNWLDNYNPSSGSVYSQIPDSNEKDIASAEKAAQSAFPNWSKTSLKERSAILLRIAELITKNLDDLALAECIDNGKPLALAKKVDIPRAAANISFFATAILHENSDAHEMNQVAINYTLRRPIGVVGCISPWNLPLYLFTWKIAPALAAGNTVVAKPSEVTPMTAYLFSKICHQAGLPKGVLNIVHGLGTKVGEAITKHPNIKAISFTGGTATGKKIAAIAAPMFKKLSLELGGKNPNIIFADCDLDKAVSTSVLSAFSNQGQICLCGSRIFIERKIYEEFKKLFLEKVKRLTIGDPLDTKTKIGALVSKDHMEKVLQHIQIAKDDGGILLNGGEQYIAEGRCENGYFITPTIFEGLSYDCPTNQEEIFGPVVTLSPFDSEDEVVKYANSTKYGLSATVWTKDLSKANRLSHSLQSGIIWVNCWLVRDLRTPFGGVKESGVGREGGSYALNFFTETTNVCISYD